MTSNWKYVLFLSIAVFFFWGALCLYVPILPVYTESFGASLSMVGAVVAAYAIPQVLFRIPAGILFDTISQRKLILAGGILMASAGALGLGLAPNPWVLFWSRAVTGIGAATWVTFTVYFIAHYNLEDTRRAIGIINFVQRSGVVVATFFGGLIAENLTATHTFWGAALLGGIALLALLAAPGPGTAQIEPFSWRRFKQVAVFPPLLMASFLGILLVFAIYSCLFGFVPVYAAQIGASSAELGVITTLSMGAAAIAAMVVAQLSKTWSNSLFVLLGSMVLGAATLSITLVDDVNLLKVVMAVYGLGMGMQSTTLMSIAIQYVDPGQRATAMGIYQATYAVGMFLGPLISGFLAESLGLAAVFRLSASLCLIIAVMAFLPVLAGPRLLKGIDNKMGGQYP